MTRDDKIPSRRRKTQQRASQTHSAPSSDLFTATVRSDLRAECVREYRFHPTRRWRFDYAIPAHHIAIEVEGGVWTGGRHTSPKGFLGDIEKYNTATHMGGERPQEDTPAGRTEPVWDNSNHLVEEERRRQQEAQETAHFTFEDWMTPSDEEAPF